MEHLDGLTAILESANALLSRINSRPGHTPATAEELAAALTTNIVVDCLTSQLDYLRDPGHYWEEEYHGQ